MGEHVCPVCEKEFTADRDATYCSVECMSDGYEKDRIHKNCLNCGKEMELYPSEDDRKYCSQDCANEYKRENSPTGEDHWLYERTTSECEYCGEEFEHIPSKERRFCSYECNGEWNSEFRDYPSGSENPNWGGGVARVTQSAKWNDVREDILERDRYRCQECGHDENLHVHHITPLSEGGRPFDPDNLKTLCKTCHRGKHFA